MNRLTSFLVFGFLCGQVFGGEVSVDGYVSGVFGARVNGYYVTGVGVSFEMFADGHTGNFWKDAALSGPYTLGWGGLSLPLAQTGVLDSLYFTFTNVKRTVNADVGVSTSGSSTIDKVDIYVYSNCTSPYLLTTWNSPASTSRSIELQSSGSPPPCGIEGATFVPIFYGTASVGIDGWPRPEAPGSYFYMASLNQQIDFRLTGNYVATVPEPSTYRWLLGGGLVALFGLTRMRTRRRESAEYDPLLRIHP